jgi:vacuolar-type H+-ATPase subunit H
MNTNIINEVSRIKEIMSYKTIINETSTTKNDNLLSEAGIVDVAGRLARYASQDLLNEIGTVLKKSITKIEDLTSDDLIKILGKEGTHINSFKQSLFKEIEKDFTWLGKKEAQNMTVRDLSSKFYELGYEKGIAGKYAKWLENQKKGLKFKPSTKTPKVTPNPPTPPTTTIPGLTPQEEMKIIGPILDEEMKLQKIAIPRGYRELFLKEVLKESNKIINQALPKIEGKGEKFFEWFDKMSLKEKEKVFKEVQSDVLKIKDNNTGVVKIFMEYLTFYKDPRGTFVNGKTDYKKAMLYAIVPTAVSFVMDGMRMAYNDAHGQEFQGRFFDLFGDTGTWVAYGAKAAGYMYGPAAVITSTIIAIDSILEYFYNVLLRRKNPKKGRTGISDFGLKMTIKDAKEFVGKNSDKIGIDAGDIIRYELVDSKNALMADQEGEGRFVNVYVNGEFFTKLEQGYLQKTSEVKL